MRLWCSIAVAALASTGALARAQSVGFVVTGEPTAAASRTALRGSHHLRDMEDVEIVESLELRRALAGVPTRDGAEDAFADLRQMARTAVGERARPRLLRIGRRLGLDLIVTVRRAGGELELRAFNVSRQAFYEGTLMVDASRVPGRQTIEGFVLPRATATQPQERPPSERPGRQGPWWGRWWVWAIVAGAVVVVGAVAYVADPGDGQAQDVRLRIVAP